MNRDEWNQRYAATELVWTATPNRTFVAEVSSLPPGRALDLGAGEGRNAVWLAQQGWDVTAVDFSEVALAKAEQLAATAGVDITTRVADVVDHTPEARAFDLVAVVYLHLPGEHRTATYRRAAAAVAPGGTLLVLGHDTINISEGHGGPRDAEVLFTPDDVVADLDGSGLVLVKSHRVLRTVTTSDGTRTAIDALVTAQRPAVERGP